MIKIKDIAPKPKKKDMRGSRAKQDIPPDWWNHGYNIILGYPNSNRWSTPKVAVTQSLRIPTKNAEPKRYAR